MNQYHIAIQKLYVAYFNRAADYSGLEFWADAVARQGGNTAAVSASFAGSQEYKATYAGMSNANIVQKVYQNLFGRAGEADGVKFWAGHLDAGRISIDNVVTAIASGARGTDLTAYEAKVAAAGAFTEGMDTAEKRQAYEGAAALQMARDYLSAVKDAGSLGQARAAVSETLGLMQRMRQMDADGKISHLGPNVSQWQGGEGADFVFVNNNTGAALNLGNGNNFVSGTGNALKMNAGGGNDVVMLAGGSHALNLGDGANSLRNGAGNITYVGGSSSDQLELGPGNHHLNLGGGRNLLYLYGGTVALEQYSTLHNAQGQLRLLFGSQSEFNSGLRMQFKASAQSDTGLSSLRALADAAIAHSGLSGDLRLSWFQFQGDTWLVANLHGANDRFVEGKDSLLKIEGLWNLADTKLAKTDGYALQINFQDLSTQKIVLNSNQSRVQGSAGDDYFVADLANSGEGLHPNLQLDGAGGLDTVKISAAKGQDLLIPASVQLNNVEQVELTLDSYRALKLDASRWQGLQEVTLNSKGNTELSLSRDTSLNLNANFSETNFNHSNKPGKLLLDGGKNVRIDANSYFLQEMYLGTVTPVSGSVDVKSTLWDFGQYDRKTKIISVHGGTAVKLDVTNMSFSRAELHVNGSAQTSSVDVKYRDDPASFLSNGTLTVADAGYGVAGKAASIRSVKLDGIGSCIIKSNDLQTLSVLSGVDANLSLYNKAGANGSLELSSSAHKFAFSDQGGLRNLNWSVKGTTHANLDLANLQSLNFSGRGQVELSSVANLRSLQTLKISDSVQLSAYLHKAPLLKVDASAAQLGQSLVLNAGLTSFVGGNGADLITLDTSGLQTLQVIDGGGGQDTLRLNSSQLRMLQESGQWGQKIINFEGLQLDAGQEEVQLDMASLPWVKSLDLSTAQYGTRQTKITNLQAGADLKLHGGTYYLSGRDAAGGLEVQFTHKAGNLGDFQVENLARLKFGLLNYQDSGSSFLSDGLNLISGSLQTLTLSGVRNYFNLDVNRTRLQAVDARDLLEAGSGPLNFVFRLDKLERPFSLQAPLTAKADNQIWVNTVSAPFQYSGGAGVDTVHIGAGNFTHSIALGDGRNHLQAQSGNYQVSAGGGEDSVELGKGQHTVNLGNGTNSLNALGNVRYSGGSDTDYLILSEGRHYLNLGGGIDSVRLVSEGVRENNFITLAQVKGEVSVHNMYFNLPREMPTQVPHSSAATLNDALQALARTKVGDGPGSYTADVMIWQGNTYFVQFEHNLAEKADFVAAKDNLLCVEGTLNPNQITKIYDGIMIVGLAN